MQGLARLRVLEAEQVGGGRDEAEQRVRVAFGEKAEVDLGRLVMDHAERPGVAPRAQHIDVQPQRAVVVE